MRYKVTGFVGTDNLKPVVIDFEGDEIKSSQDADRVIVKGRKALDDCLKTYTDTPICSISGIQYWEPNAMANNWVELKP